MRRFAGYIGRLANSGSDVTNILDSVNGPGIRLRLILTGVMLFLLGWSFGHVEAKPVVYTHAEIFHALHQVESSGRLDPPDGDGGRAIGPYQIHRPYWSDAGLKGDYQDCRNRAYAERVIRSYMKRFVPEAWKNRDAEIIARTHNGGPRGAEKKATDGYWARVHRALRAARE